MLLTGAFKSQRLSTGLHIMQEIRVGQLDASEVNFDATLDGPTLTLPERLIDDISGGAYALDRQKSLEREKYPHDDTVGLSNTTIQRILSSMVIIVPCKNEAPETIEGVLSGIPNSCVVILVSNSARTPVDRYEQEIQMLQRVCHRTQRRRAFAIHQKDEGVAAALDAAGMVGLTDPADGKIRNGKGEGMLLGVALAAVVCPDMQYVGFIDADNQVPGAVHEYCRIYAAGFALVPTSREHAMVRLRWASKPKVRDNQLCFDGEGRSSIFVNAWLNRLVKTLSRKADNKETNLIVTGNAGEHAMSMELALKLRMAGGYAVEPFHFIDLFQRQGVFAKQADKDSNYEASTHHEDNNGMSTNTKPLYQRRDRAPPIAPLVTSTAHRSLEKPVRILQIRTLNPHFHRPSDDQHIRGMLESGLGAIYHAIGAGGLRDEMRAFLAGQHNQQQQQQQQHAASPTNPTTLTVAPQSEATPPPSPITMTATLAPGEHNGLKHDDSAAPLLPHPHIYPPVEQLDLARLRAALAQEQGAAHSLRRFTSEGGRHAGAAQRWRRRFSPSVMSTPASTGTSTFNSTASTSITRKSTATSTNTTTNNNTASAPTSIALTLLCLLLLLLGFFVFCTVVLHGLLRTRDMAGVRRDAFQF